MSGFSLHRFAAVLFKEFIQMRRDRVTFGTMIGVPVMQLLLFGYAINTDPRHLATLVEMRDTSPTSRAILMSMQASEYFEFTGTVDSAEEAATALREGRATVVLTIPNGFERDLIRGLQPELLLTADASDPTATAAATSAISRVVDTALSETRAALGTPSLPAPPINVVTHRAFNPEGRGRIWNTFDAHRLLHWAELEGAQGQQGRMGIECQDAVFLGGELLPGTGGG